MRYAFDIDGTLCKTKGTDYPNAVPIEKAIKEVNRLYDAGNAITIWTGRGGISKIDWSDLTKKQLKEWGVKYHELRMDKVPYDLMIDDCAIDARVWHDNL